MTGSNVRSRPSASWPTELAGEWRAKRGGTLVQASGAARSEAHHPKREAKEFPAPAETTRLGNLRNGREGVKFPLDKVEHGDYISARHLGQEARRE
jgi:hypothetical protein